MGAAMRRWAAGLILFGGSLTVADVGVASAGAGATTEQWRGHGAGVFVTNCVLTSTAGTRCTAWEVFAFRERVSFNGDRFAQRGVFVQVFDVTITDVPTEPLVVPGDRGFLPNADVAIPPDLASARGAGRVPLADCTPASDPHEPDVCVPTGASVDVDVQWTATGRATRFTARFHLLQSGSLLNARYFSRARPAAALAEINGNAVTVVPEPFAPGPVISADAEVDVCVRCDT